MDKTDRIGIRVSPEDKAKWQSEAKDLGIPLSRHISTLLGKYEKYAQYLNHFIEQQQVIRMNVDSPEQAGVFYKSYMALLQGEDLQPKFANELFLVKFMKLHEGKRFSFHIHESYVAVAAN